MEESIDRELEAILNLIKLTQNGTVIWQAAKPWGDLVENESTKYTSVMLCKYMDKRLRLFIEHMRIDKPSPYVYSAILGYPDQKYPYWTADTVLEITNVEGQSLWRFPNKPATRDLLAAVKYQVAGVKEVLDSLLQRPPEPA